MNDLPKAKWLKIEWIGIIKIQGKLMIKPMYTRMANASTLWISFLKITWRMPWLPHAAYSQGWDAAFRQFGMITPERGEDK